MYYLCSGVSYSYPYPVVYPVPDPFEVPVAPPIVSAASVPKAKAGVEGNPYAAVASVAYPVED